MGVANFVNNEERFDSIFKKDAGRDVCMYGWKPSSLIRGIIVAAAKECCGYSLHVLSVILPTSRDRPSVRSPPPASPPVLLRYPFLEQGMVINEFENNEGDIFPVPEGMPTTAKEIYYTFLDAYGYGERDDQTDVLGQVVRILVDNLVVFRVLALHCLKFITFERR